MEKFDFEPSFVRVASFSRPTATFCRPSTEWSPFSMIRNPFPRTHLRVSKRNACILSLSLSVGSRACMPVRTGNFGVAYTHDRGAENVLRGAARGRFFFFFSSFLFFFEVDSRHFVPFARTPRGSSAADHAANDRPRRPASWTGKQPVPFHLGDL